MLFQRLNHSLGLAALYGILHALVDATTVTTTYVVLRRHQVPPEAGVLIVWMYDLIAFSSQPFFGAIIDKSKSMRFVATVGIVLCLAGALLVPTNPYVAAIVAGVGNALFHLGAGVVSMSIRPGRAAAPGVFVGPGTLGLAFGIYWGKFRDFVPVWLMALLFASLVVPLFAPHPEKMGAHNLPKPNNENPAFSVGAVALALLLVSIVFRSLVGHAASYACPQETLILFGLASAGCIGKMSGGLLSDRLGWKAVTVGALLISAPFIAFGGDNPALIAIGGGLFQMTMPVTLVAAVALMPNRPGLVFGLNCLAFVGGAIPVFAGILRPYYGSLNFLIVIAAAVGAVWGGLHLISPYVFMRFALDRASSK